MANLTRQDRADILADTIGSLEACIVDMDTLGTDYAAEVDQLRDIISAMTSELVEISDELWQESERNDDAIMRDYHKSLL